MKNWSIFKQILISNLAVLLLAIAIITLLTIPKQKAEFNTALTQHAELLLNTLDKAIVDELYFMDIDYLTGTLQSLVINNDNLSFCRIYDAEGHIIADSFNSDITFSNEADPFGSVVLTENKQLIRWEKDQLMVGKKIEIENQILGLLVIALPTKNHQKVLFSLRKQIFITSIIAIILGSLLSLFISNKITNPIKEMAKKTIDISNGNFKDPIYIFQRNELGLLAESFNKMMKELSVNIKKLKISEDRFSYAVKGTNDGIWDWDIKNDRFYFSQRWKNMLGFKDNEIKNTKKAWFDLINKSDIKKVQKALDKHLQGESEYFTVEYRIKCKNNEYIWVLCKGLGSRNRKGEIIRIAGSQTDITERKNNEKKIQKSLEEKEILLKEIHHRVKNNLAIIQSLIRFDAKILKSDKKGFEVLQKLQNRIQSISLIHQLLYDSKDMSRIKADKYLTQIITNLKQTINSKNKEINILLKSVSSPIDIEILKTCGLIINELITNSIKYAFPDNKGNIEVILKKDRTEYILEVNDNGTGFPENFNAARIKSSGLFLVKTLSQGIDANLEFRNHNGAHTLLVFPAKLKRKKTVLSNLYNS